MTETKNANALAPTGQFLLIPEFGLKEEHLPCVGVTKTYKKDKDGKLVTVDRNGVQVPLVTSERLTFLPRTSKDKPSINTVFGLTGQAAMRFDHEVRRQVGIAKARRMLSLLENGGSYVARSVGTSANGSESLSIKLVTPQSAPMTVDALEQKAKELGFSLVPIKTGEAKESESPAVESGPALTELETAEREILRAKRKPSKLEKGRLETLEKKYIAALPRVQ